MLMLRNINKLAPNIRHEIVAYLKDHKISQVKLAQMYNVHREVIKRIAKTENLCLGRGPVKFWQYEKMTLELAYIVGAYLTDGNISGTTFSLRVKDKEFAQHAFDCLQTISINPQYRPFTVKNKGSYFGVYGCSRMFVTWLNSVCCGKHCIPNDIFDAPIAIKMSFVSAVIDGDGSPNQRGLIYVNGCGEWLRQFPHLLNVSSIENGGWKLRQITRGGKEYGEVRINRLSFLEHGGKCIIPRKQARIEKLLRYYCPACGKQAKRTKEAKQCQSCYFNRADR